MKQIEYVDVAFCFDEKIARYVCVAINSLLTSHINSDYQYRIHCITVPKGQKKVNVYLQNLAEKYNSILKFYLLDYEVFKNSYEIRHITVATYFRFFIPELLTDINKVIYLDADVIIRGELCDLMQFGMDDIFFRGVKSYINLPKVWASHNEMEYWDEMKKCRGRYINAGIIIMNLEAIRESGIAEKWKALTVKKFHYQDQDIINLTCSEKCKFIPPKYNMMVYLDDELLCSMAKEDIYSEREIEEAICNPVIIHYNGGKPWQTFLTTRLFMSNEWWKRVLDDKVLLEWFKDDLINCIKNCQEEQKNVIWRARRNNANYMLMNNWLQLKQEGYSLANVLKQKKYNIIAIYGMSYIGERVCDELRDSDIMIEYGIDKVKKGNYNQIEIYNLDAKLPVVDAIIVTAIFSFDKIFNEISRKVNMPIVSIQDLLKG